MAPLEPWEKVLVSADEFPQSAHGKLECVVCHGGQQSADKDTAHAGLIPGPSEDPQAACGACHPDVVAVFPESLHATQQGYWTVIEARSVPESHVVLETMFDNHCARCHTACGDCHVSQPSSVGGGLLNGHVFEATPPMTRSCTACHGSRVGDEYLGKHEDVPGDVHFREGRMNCMNCHTGVELHGGSTDPQPDASLSASEHRYGGERFPRCETCHPAVLGGPDGNDQHRMHAEDLSCQVCHSITYTNCNGCHVALSETTGRPYFETQATYAAFVIGRNPLPSAERPYAYVPVRHIPVAPTSYQFYGEGLLPNFDGLPTWAYATPHNIQRSTPQNASCNACHGNAALFLTADKVAPAELGANRAVIVENVPPAVTEP